MTPVEIAARLYAWGTATDRRTHWMHGTIAAVLISLPVTFAAHTLVFRWVALAGGTPAWASWLVAGSYGLVAAGAAYSFRESAEGFRRWISGELGGVDAHFESRDARWDVFAAWIGGAVPGPAIAFLPDLVAAIL